MAPPLLYHEKQVSLLCGVHALNALLQGPYFSAHDLGTIAQEFDEKERQLLGDRAQVVRGEVRALQQRVERVHAAKQAHLLLVVQKRRRHDPNARHETRAPRSSARARVTRPEEGGRRRPGRGTRVCGSASCHKRCAALRAHYSGCCREAAKAGPFEFDSSSAPRTTKKRAARVPRRETWR